MALWRGGMKIAAKVTNAPPQTKLKKYFLESRIFNLNLFGFFNCAKVSKVNPNLAVAFFTAPAVFSLIIAPPLPLWKNTALLFLFLFLLFLFYPDQRFIIQEEGGRRGRFIKSKRRRRRRTNRKKSDDLDSPIFKKVILKDRNFKFITSLFVCFLRFSFPKKIKELNY